MDLTTQLTFHAGYQWVHFPYTTAESAVRFLDSANVDYVVLRRLVEPWGDYYRDWLEHSIPDLRAKLVNVCLQTLGDYRVFRWHPTSTNAVAFQK